MNIDILLTGVTGFVGRFVLLEIIEKYPKTKIGVIIRPLKNKTPIERFSHEIIHDTMFSKYAAILSKVSVISTSIEEIEKTSLYIKSSKTIIHCAANVKHYDPYEVLYKDNVKNIKVIMDLAHKLKCMQLILLSTCYVRGSAPLEPRYWDTPSTPRGTPSDSTATSIDNRGLKGALSLGAGSDSSPNASEGSNRGSKGAKPLGVNGVSPCLKGAEPPGVNGVSPYRIPNMPRECFYNDYCYTKWLGEEEVFKLSNTDKDKDKDTDKDTNKNTNTHMKIDIMRLSCVGSPIRKDLQAHPFSAQAHLGIISLINRGYISTIGLNNTSRLSIIPVDIASKYIVSKVIVSGGSGGYDERVEIHQVCSPKHLEAYHPNLHTIVLIANKEFNRQIKLVKHDGSSPHYLPQWYSVARYMNKDIDKYVDLHEKVQEFVLLFTSDDIRFDSSLTPDYFPDISEYKLLMDTYSYCIRNTHQLQYKKGVPLEGKDKFWHDMGKKEHVQACLKLTEPVDTDKDSIDRLKTNLWSLFCSTRKFTTSIIDGKWVYNPGLLDSYFSMMEFEDCDSDSDSTIESIIIRRGLNKINKNMWHCDLVVQRHADKKQVTHLLIQMDHGIADGIGLMKPIVNRLNYSLADKEVRELVIPKKTRISIKDEIISFIVFLFLNIFFYLASSSAKYKGEYVKSPDICSCTIPLVKYKNRTFTTNLLYDLTKTLYTHTREDTILYCIPSYIGGGESDTEQIHNNFVPILLHVNGNSTIEEVTERTTILRSGLIRIMMSKLVEFITYMGWEEIRKVLISKVTCIVSSVNMGSNMGDDFFSSVHIATTTPEPILYCVTAISNEKETFITVRSHDALVSAKTIISGLMNTHI